MKDFANWPLTAAPFRGNRFAWVGAPLHGFTRYEPVRYGWARSRLLWAQEDNKWGVMGCQK